MKWRCYNNDPIELLAGPEPAQGQPAGVSGSVNLVVPLQTWLGDDHNLVVLRETLRQLGVSDVDMSQGSLRCDANVSVRPRGTHGQDDCKDSHHQSFFHDRLRFLECGVLRRFGFNQTKAAKNAALQSALTSFR